MNYPKNRDTGTGSGISRQIIETGSGSGSDEITRPDPDPDPDQIRLDRSDQVRYGKKRREDELSRPAKKG
jgi:hypothetical protein